MKKTIIFAILFIIALVLINSSVYVVRQDQTAVVKTFGKVVAFVTDENDAEFVSHNLEVNGMEGVQSIPQKGLHFKMPFVQSVDIFTSKYLTYMSTTETIYAKDGRQLDIQMYAQYKIKDPVTFELALKNKEDANLNMDQLVYPVVIQSVNSLNFYDFFDENKLEDLLESRQELLNQQLAKDYGLYVTDIGISRKNFPDANVSGIEQKMTMQIQKESEKLTAEGDSEYQQKKAIADRQKAELVSAAVEKAAVIKANADAQAIKIYQDSLNKDLDFYQFIKRMEIYRNLKDKTIFLDSDNDIFDSLNGYQ